jgi:hypothetical protein
MEGSVEFSVLGASTGHTTVSFASPKNPDSPRDPVPGGLDRAKDRSTGAEDGAQYGKVAAVR